jgi:hypothetical protein
MRPESQITRRDLLQSLVASAAMASVPTWARDSAPTARLTLGASAAAPVPIDYLGFSYESAQLADPTFFAEDNHELISLFGLLSEKGVLRIGGNSSEFCWWKAKPEDRPPELPASAHAEDNWMPHTFTAIEPIAIDRLAGFLQATGWKAIYGLNLGTGSPERDAEEAAYVAAKLGTRLLYFQIGNEPEFYRNPNNRLRPPDWDFDKYLAQWMSFARAVIQRVPDARFGGPDVGSNAEWVVRFAQEAPKQLPGRIVACTSHYYAEGPPDDPRTTVERLLAPDFRVERDVPRMIEVARRSNVEYRMAEGNSCYRGGKPGLSNAFCSALWAADYLLTLASYGTAGVNLHGGGAKQIRMSLGGHLPGEQLVPDAASVAAEGSFYTPIAGSRETRFSARPVFYGMKLAGLLAGGKMRAINPKALPAGATAWAADMPTGETRVIVLNKNPRDKLDVAISSTGEARVWRLEAPSLTATSGVTLAGAVIRPGEAWKPVREERIVSKAGGAPATVPAASGAALFFSNLGLSR